MTTTTSWDALSTTNSETSAAVVSLYQSWAGASLCGSKSSSTSGADDREDGFATEEFGCFTITTTSITAHSAGLESNSNGWWNPAQGDDEITLQGLEDDVVEDTAKETCLRRALRKRLSSELDIPQVPLLKRRRKPVCHFINFMGKRHVEEEPEATVTPPIVAEDPRLWHLNLGLDERDALFPMMVDDPDDEPNTLLETPVIVAAKKVFVVEITDDDPKQTR